MTRTRQGVGIPDRFQTENKEEWNKVQRETKGGMDLLVILGDRDVDTLLGGGCVFTTLRGETVGIVTERAVCKIVEYAEESEDEQQ